MTRRPPMIVWPEGKCVPKVRELICTVLQEIADEAVAADSHESRQPHPPRNLSEGEKGSRRRLRVFSEMKETICQNRPLNPLF